MKSLRSRLQNSATLLAHSIDAAGLEQIRGPEDVAQPVYQESLDLLRRLRRSNPDVAFLYIMRLDKDVPIFVVDSDETDAQALPGQVYEDMPPTMKLGFFEPSVNDQLYQDEWGTFLSGYAPLRNGAGRYLIGIDMDAQEVAAKLHELKLTALISLLASILLALFFAHLLSQGLADRIVDLAGRCRAIALGRPAGPIERRSHDEFDELAEAYNTMNEQLELSRAEAARSLQEVERARDQLETRVQERTAELEGMLERVRVLRGLLPICSCCKKIRDDDGYWQQVELFVEKHADVRFSHSICPDCLAEQYGYLDQDKDP
ncbi:MAG: hypothetical protein H7A43_00750 [Verrucomicrobia bacterium]|nr:hypothetical protein [Kiritimatiellia bacterium]MCB1101304.1 hypothetical protein [Kiritimatiellia bacterium]MCP5487157.1 hypothetical protein [Verrucomicrobiota bacterium]